MGDELIKKLGTGLKVPTDETDIALDLHSDPILPKKGPVEYVPSIKVWNMISFMRVLRARTLNENVIKTGTLWYEGTDGDIPSKNKSCDKIKDSYWWGSADKVQALIDFLKAYDKMIQETPPTINITGSPLRLLYNKTDMPQTVLNARKAWCKLRGIDESGAEMFRLYLL